MRKNGLAAAILREMRRDTPIGSVALAQRLKRRRQNVSSALWKLSTQGKVVSLSERKNGVPQEWVLR